MNLRIITANFVAPIAALLVPALLAISGLDDVFVNTDGSIDDAGQRGAGLFFAILPFIYCLAVAYYFGASSRLLNHQLSLLAVLKQKLMRCIIAALISAAFFLLALFSFESITLPLGVFSSIVSLFYICSIFGNITWWLIVYGLTSHARETR